MNDEKIVLNDEELNIINRVRHGKFPNKSFDPYQPHLPYYTNEKRVEMIGNAREPKRRFIPSKNEARMVVKLVNAIRNGWIKPYGYKEENKEPEVYMLWGDDDQTDDPRHRPPVAIPPPKPKLPGHAESYNPPGEYVPTQEEKNAWEMLGKYMIILYVD